MRLCFSGSREHTDPDIIQRAVLASGWRDDMAAAFLAGQLIIVHGDADGVDKLADLWARNRGIPVEPHPAKWQDIDKPGAIVRTNRKGHRYNAVAGHWRNEEMAVSIDRLISIPYGMLHDPSRNKGTRDMIERCRRHGRSIYVYQGG